MLRRRILKAALLCGLIMPSALIMTSCRPHDYGMKFIVYLPDEAVVSSDDMLNLIRIISEGDFMNFYIELKRITDNPDIRPDQLQQLVDSGDAKLMGHAKITNNEDDSNLVEFTLNLASNRLSIWNISILLIPSKERVIVN